MRRTLVGLGLLLGLLGWQGAAWAQTFPRYLEDIRVYGSGETVQLAFSGPYDGLPTQEFRPGEISLTFPGIGSTKPVRDLRPLADSVYRQIQVRQGLYATTVTFLLKDARLNLKDQLMFTRDQNLLNVDVRLPGMAEVPAPTRRDPRQPLLTQMEERIVGTANGDLGPVVNKDGASAAVLDSPVTAPPATPAATPAAKPLMAQARPSLDAAPALLAQSVSPLPVPNLGGLKEGDFWFTFATMVLALVVMLAALYGVLLLYKKVFQSRLTRFAGTPAVRQVAAFSIGPRQRIVIVEIQGEQIACGVTPTQITFLARLTGREAAERRAEPAGSAQQAPQAVPTRVEQAGALVGLAGAKADPVQQFTDALKQRVRGLKRIH